jgi:hypothetical protein
MNLGSVREQLASSALQCADPKIIRNLFIRRLQLEETEGEVCERRRGIEICGLLVRNSLGDSANGNSQGLF